MECGGRDGDLNPRGCLLGVPVVKALPDLFSLASSSDFSWPIHPVPCGLRGDSECSRG